MAQPSDAAVRKQALNTEESFAVSAPAGSGKTGLLTQRTLALLAKCDQPENILAITFTKKAAAEMQHRILSAIEQARHSSEPDDEHARTTWHLARKVIERDQQLNWQLSSLPQRLRITTIDSFCRQIAQQSPLTNGIGQIGDMLNDAERTTVFQQAARDLLSLNSSDEVTNQKVVQLISHLNNQLGYAEELLVEMLARRDQWIGPLFSARDQRHVLEDSLQALLNDQLEQLTQLLLPFAGELLPLISQAASYLIETGSDSDLGQLASIDELPSPSAHGLEQWRLLINFLLTDKNEPRKRLDKKIGFVGHTEKTLSKDEKAAAKVRKESMTALLAEIANDSELLSALITARHLPHPEYSENQWLLLETLTEILPRLYAQCKQIFQQLGKTDFIEVSHAALRALGTEDQPTDLTLALDYRIQHILVDEFQDTSSPQRSLLLKLTAGWQVGDGRTLFVVGDAMQSCYGFRDANVGIFLEAREQGLGDIRLTPLDLTVNFRSQQRIVEWTNQLFSQCFPHVSDSNSGAVSYQLAESQKPITVEPAVISQVLVYPKTEAEAYEKAFKERQDEAEQIVATITKVRQQRPDDSIAILVRSRNQVPAITRLLSENNLVYRATEIEKLEQQMVVIDLMSLTRALLYPNDRIAWLSLLRAPWCGLDMADLLATAQFTVDNQQPTLYSTILKFRDQLPLSENGKMVLERLATVLEQAFNQRGRFTLRQWVEGVWLALGGPALLVDTDERHSIEAYWQLLETYQKGLGISHWPTFKAAVTKLYVNVPLAESNQQPIEILTIHKSKGLEYDTVIIPGLDISSRGESSSLLVWQEWLDEHQNSQLLMSPLSASENDSKDPIYQFLKYWKSQKQAYESDRLFYVGCTRAKTQLYLLGQLKSDETPIKSPPSGNSTLARIWPFVADQIKYLPVKASISSDNQLPPNKIVRLKPDLQLPSLPDNPLLAKYRLHNEIAVDDNRAKPDALQQRLARYKGTALHRALQQMTETGVSHWDKKRVKQQEPFWVYELKALGLNQANALTTASEISAIITNLLSSEKALWVLDNTHSQSACELTLCDHQVTHVIDRTFIDKVTGERWIIDYKSSEPQPMEPLDTFLDRETETYRAQLARYAKLFKDENGPVKAALYFPLLDKLHPIAVQ